MTREDQHRAVAWLWVALVVFASVWWCWRPVVFVLSVSLLAVWAREQ